MDWVAAALPVEGELAGRPRAIDVTRPEVPRCRRDERVAEVRARVGHAGWDRAVVLSETDVVLGLLPPSALEADAETLVETVMEPGPSTIRPGVALETIGDYLAEGADSTLVTTAEGVLLGVLRRADAVRRLRETAG